MLAPTPVLKPGPLDIGGLFSGSIEALKRRFWLLVLIALMPALITLVVIVAGMALILPSIVGLANGHSAIAGLVAGVTVMLAGTIVAALAQLKSYGMLSLAAYEIAQGQFPDFGGLFARTRGFLPRMAVVIAISVGGVLLVYLLLFLALAGVVASAAAAGDRGSGAGFFAAFGISMLLLIAAVPVALFLTTKLLYTVPAVALEGLGGIDAMKRSWNLTRGAFWRTLGYYLVGYLMVAAASYVASMLSQVVLVPFGLSTSSISQSSDPGQVMAVLAGIIPAMLIVLALQVVVQVVAYPFLQAYTTYMFIDQVRRSEMPAAPTYGYPTVPGYYTHPGQYYAPPPQGYPAPGPNPGQGWQAPGPWTPPGPGQQPPQPWGGQQNPPQGGHDWTQGQQPPSGPPQG